MESFSRRFEFAMHYIFLCERYIQKHFARTLNSQAINFANISENKVLANNREFTVVLLSQEDARITAPVIGSLSKYSKHGANPTNNVRVGFH